MLHIYSSAEKISANRTLIRLSAELKNRDIHFKKILLRDILIDLQPGKVSFFHKSRIIPISEPAFFRSVGKYIDLAHIINEEAKEQKSLVIDSYIGKHRTTTKLIQNYLFAKKGLPIPRTIYSPEYSKSKIRHVVKALKFPIVIKQLETSQGDGVSIAHNTPDLERALENLSGEHVILQEYIENEFEYRILVIGKRACIAETKVRTGSDEFRNNAALGAMETFIPLSEVPREVLRAAEDASKVCSIEFSGVDITIRKDDGLPMLFEANSAPGLLPDAKESCEIAMLGDYLEKKLKQ